MNYKISVVFVRTKQWNM